MLCQQFHFHITQHTLLLLLWYKTRRSARLLFWIHHYPLCTQKKTYTDRHTRRDAHTLKPRAEKSTSLPDLLKNTFKRRDRRIYASDEDLFPGLERPLSYKPFAKTKQNQGRKTPRILQIFLPVTFLLELPTLRVYKPLSRTLTTGCCFLMLLLSVANFMNDLSFGNGEGRVLVSHRHSNKSRPRWLIKARSTHFGGNQKYVNKHTWHKIQSQIQ